MISRRILVIDDNPGVRETMRLLLNGIGMKAYIASNGIDGLALAYEEEPDLILLDILLPDFSGWAVLDQLRIDRRMAHIPVAIFSALVDSEAHYRDCLSKVDGYLSKPFTMQELRELIIRTTANRPKVSRSRKKQVFAEI